MSARDDFLDASFWYGGTERAQAILDAHPQLAGSDIFVAATLGDDASVARFLAQDRSLAKAKSGPRDSEPLIYLCFSRYLAHDASRSDAFARAATALLDAGADPNAGFFDGTHTPHPEWESALYGAAGVAHHAGVTQLLIEHGADPNDAEVPYHSPEGYGNNALKILLDSGKLTKNSLHVMLLRKSDWHDYEGVKLVLACAPELNRMTPFHRTPLHHAILSDNDLRIIELLLDHGADPRIVAENLQHGGPARQGRSSTSLAARRGRGDVLDVIERHGFSLDLDAVDEIIAACARGRVEDARHADAATRRTLRADAGMLLCEFAGNDNADGVACLLALDLPIDAPYEHADGYFDVTPKTTALHNAAWRASHDVVELLVKRGANVNALDSKGRTPLVQAVRAATESYWMRRRSPRSIKALLDAGATTEGVKLPTGYDAADQIIAPHISRSL